jgi:hypothetical protein
LDFESVQNGLDDPVGVAENVVAPKPDHCPALPFQQSGSARVHRIVGMLTAIDLDHQQIFGAGEIDNETADWMLPAELVPQQAAIAQRRPHAPFGIRRGPPQSASILIGHRRKLPALGK